MLFPRLSAWLPALLALTLVAACDKDDKDESAKAEDSAEDEGKAEDEAGKDDKDDEGSKGDADEEDKGHAKMKLGEQPWNATRTSARIKDGKLRIYASRARTPEGERERGKLTLVIRDYEGPGSYKTDKVNSNFAGVNFDIEAAEKAAEEKDDAKTKELVENSLKTSTIILLQDAKVEITSADDDFIDGTLDWSGIGSVKGPREVSGSFHARIKKD